ncbi:TonB-dependent receptor [uncultured Sphingomonas sp.]|uniref:TonB-dependent receptor n=1 Tax=uncultured Sphingomonas sp. TaxID=158754 RepID=UPI0035CACFD7
MRNGLNYGISLLALAVAGPAWAQTTTPAPSAGQDTTAPTVDPEQPAARDLASGQSGDIIVTANKREQTLQDTPIAVSVTSAATIEQAQIRDLIDLQTVVPSLRVSQTSSSGQTNFFIRGFGNGANNPGIEPSVGVFIDGVYRSRSAAQITDLPNIERVEVLRGPQSTLFGKNASAGVISVVTQRPQFKFGGSIAGTYGNFDQYVVKADVTGPIVADLLAFSLSGNYNKRDGFVRVENLDRKINDRDRYDIRGQLLFSPGNDLEVRIIGDYSKLDELCCAARNVLAGPTIPALDFVAGQTAVNRNSPDPDRIRLSRLPRNRIENYGASGQIDYSIGDLTLTSITAYRELRSDVVDDGDFTAADVTTNMIDTKIDTFTQELRVASNFDGPINFLLGGFYFNEDIQQINALDFGVDTRDYLNLLAGGAPTAAGGTTGGGIGTVETLLGRPPRTFQQPGRAITDEFGYKDESYSIFGTVDFKPFDRLTLTGGFNYTEDKKRVRSNVVSNDAFSAVDLVQLYVGLGGPPQFANTPRSATVPAGNPFLGLQGLQFLPPFLNFPNAVESGRTNDDDWSYTVRAAYEASDTINLYATYATGFKASSYNLSRDSRPSAADFISGSAAGRPAPAASPIRTAGLALPNLTNGTRFAGPEQSEVLEAGLKADFGRVKFNVAVFDQSIKGFQENTFTGTGFALTNAGRQSTRGFEFEGSVTPVDPLTLFVAVTYLDTEYNSYTGSPLGDLSGQDVETVSPITMSIGGAYTQEFGAGQKLIVRTDYQYASQAQVSQGLPGFVTTVNGVRDASAARAIGRAYTREVDELNLSATLQLTNGLEFSAYARNLLNDRYLTAIFDGVAQPGSVYGFYNQPRTYGGSVRFKF